MKLFTCGYDMAVQEYVLFTGKRLLHRFNGLSQTAHEEVNFKHAGKLFSKFLTGMLYRLTSLSGRINQCKRYF